MSSPESQEPGVDAPAPDSDHMIGAARQAYHRAETAAEDVTVDGWAASVLRGEWYQLDLIAPVDGEGSDVD